MYYKLGKNEEQEMQTELAEKEGNQEFLVASRRFF